MTTRLFFLVYINDLTYSIKSASVELYADDNVLYVTNKNGEIARSKLQADLHNLSRWCSANKLSLNAKKTKQVNFGSRYQVKKLKEKDDNLFQCVGASNTWDLLLTQPFHSHYIVSKCQIQSVTKCSCSVKSEDS